MQVTFGKEYNFPYEGFLSLFFITFHKKYRFEWMKLHFHVTFLQIFARYCWILHFNWFSVGKNKLNFREE